MDIVKSKQLPGDDLKKVMSDLAKGKVTEPTKSKVEIDGAGTPSDPTPPPPPPPAPAPETAPAPLAVASAPAPVAASGSSDLNSIKLNAVAMLKPLIGSLDISAEEKFEAMIEIIRASDDQDMISQAFDTAKNIGDNDRRAQALIDIINEINYINKIKKT